MNNIKQLREAAGMKQSELADRMNVRPPTVFKWENGMANPTIANLIQLAEIFGVSLDEVVGRKTNAQKGGVVDGEKASYVV
ncbi:MAG TPA: helix-turn-helix domain-containing protein [Candidatus Oscillibacter excrementigallinarum]|uniref:Helix-turn-helix domain-containing protein n=1 Tax=Candidatus Oscillibacter excrementigallinarum TaxID=2838716 RepID=A0A9D2LKR8_9FIRM|nr:helix-turn-helix domain-containing protein [Candidatus Oscillibacter excrementigallinarum]